MSYDPRRHHRHSIRLKGYDYSLSGAYFITICVNHGQCELGAINDAEICLSSYGQIAAVTWEGLPEHYLHIELDAFVVMPNHVHGIIVLADTVPSTTKPLEVGAGLRPVPTSSVKRHGLPEIIRAFKSFSARRINQSKGIQGQPFWQRNYYEHIIRNERAYFAIREYILSNPVNWGADKLNPTMPRRRVWRRTGD